MVGTDRPNIQVDLIQELSGHRGSVYAMAVDESMMHLFSGGDDGILAKWSLDAEEPQGQAILRTDRGIYAIYVLKEHQLLFVGTSDGNIYVLDLEQLTLLHTYRHVASAVYGFFWEPTHNWLCSLHGDGYLGTLLVPELKSDTVFRISQQHLRSCAPIPGSSDWWLGASDHHVYRWQPGQANSQEKWKAHDNSVFALASGPSNEQLLTGGRDAHLNVWDMAAAPHMIQHIPAHNYTINEIAIAPSGEYVMTASRDKTIKVWRATDMALLKVIDAARNQGHTHSVNRLIWLSSDNSVLSCSDDRRIIRWQLTIQEA